MGNLTKPQVRIIENNGEITVKIDLNLNLNLNSNKINLDINEDKIENIIETEEEEFIPTFSSKEKVVFGKKGD